MREQIIYGFTRYGGPEVQEYLQVPLPDLPTDMQEGPENPEDTEIRAVVVRPTAAGINPADIKVRNGDRRNSFPVSFPMAIGREVAGIDLATGRRVVGSCLAGHGGLCQQAVLLDLATTTPIPDDLSDIDASCVPVACGTAADAIDQLTHALPGIDTLVVLGAGGGVGAFAVQFGRLRGLAVYGIASPTKKELVESLGAEHITAGQAHKLGTLQGRVGVVDCVGGDAADQVESVLASAHVEIKVVSPAAGGVPRDRSSRRMSELTALMASGAIRAVIGASFGFAEAAAAVATVESGHATGNIVVKFP